MQLRSWSSYLLDGQENKEHLEVLQNILLVGETKAKRNFDDILYSVVLYKLASNG